MVKDGWLSDHNGFISLTEKGMEWLLKYRQTLNDKYDKKEKFILLEKVKDILTDINKILDRMMSLPVNIEKHHRYSIYHDKNKFEIIYNSEVLIEEIESIDKKIRTLFSQYDAILDNIYLDNIYIMEPKYKLSDIVNYKNKYLFRARAYRYLKDMKFNLVSIKRYLEYDLYPMVTPEDRIKLANLHKELEILHSSLISLGEEYSEEIIDHLKNAVNEFEQGHFLASSLISGKVALYCVEKIKGESDENKYKTLEDLGVIDKKERYGRKNMFLKAMREIRHAISHKLYMFPDNTESLEILSMAFNMVKTYIKYLQKTQKEK